MEPPLTKIKKTQITCKKSNISLLDTSTNKPLLHKLKSKKFYDSVVLAFLECTCYIQNLVIQQKECVICVVLFSNFGNWITFGPLWIRCLFYIWTTSLITVHTFAVISSLHIGNYAFSPHLAWLNIKMFSFTLFLLNSRKGWTAAVVCD